ncbi:hypothetical protein VPH35_126001 [Triticum aestivum]|uniref:Uncharacterized protein n=1 Tax=Triticum urartu TaxID=4572 RepID=A0A8R7VBU8_TRIUA
MTVSPQSCGVPVKSLHGPNVISLLSTPPGSCAAAGKPTVSGLPWCTPSSTAQSVRIPRCGSRSEPREPGAAVLSGWGRQRQAAALDPRNATGGTSGRDNHGRWSRAAVSEGHQAVESSDELAEEQSC